MSEGTKTTFDVGIVDAVAQGLITTIRGVTTGTWFGPGQPLKPVAPPGQGVRTFDYKFATNLYYQPKTADEGISFLQLRTLAENYDLLRLMIETRKDQVVSMPWSFRVRAKQGESNQQHRKRTVSDPRVQALNDFFLYPDRLHDWATWLRMALEEVFVIDALSIAPRHALDESLYGFDIVDGSTIKRLVDVDGRTPPPPSPAYQQVLKGMPAVDLSTDDLIYRPRNPRAHKIYGYSIVEQIIITVNMALRRQMTQLSFFTEGNIPEAIAQVPDKWTPQDLKGFQEQWDILNGDLAKRSRIRFVPKLEGILFSKDKVLSDEFDEWLARIVCFAFSIAPTPFTKQVNRATSQTMQQTATSEGLLPTLNYISSVISYIANKYFGFVDIEHAFLDDEESDKLKQAQIDKIYAAYGKQSVDEQRIRDGEEPIGLGPIFMLTTGPVPVGPFLNDGNPIGVGKGSGSDLEDDEQEAGEPPPENEEQMKAQLDRLNKGKKGKSKNL